MVERADITANAVQIRRPGNLPVDGRPYVGHDFLVHRQIGDDEFGAMLGEQLRRCIANATQGCRAGNDANCAEAR